MCLTCGRPLKVSAPLPVTGHAGHGADVINVHQTGHEVVYGQGSRHPAACRGCLHLEPRLRRLLRVELGLAQGILVVEETGWSRSAAARPDGPAIDHTRPSDRPTDRPPSSGWPALAIMSCKGMNAFGCASTSSCRSGASGSRPAGLPPFSMRASFKLPLFSLLKRSITACNCCFALRPRLCASSKSGRRLSGCQLRCRFCRRLGSQHRRTGKRTSDMAMTEGGFDAAWVLQRVKGRHYTRPIIHQRATLLTNMRESRSDQTYPCSFALLAVTGCDQVSQKLGMEDPPKEAAWSRNQAVGSACRQSGRAIEDCYSIYGWLPRPAFTPAGVKWTNTCGKTSWKPSSPQLPPPGASKKKA